MRDKQKTLLVTILIILSLVATGFVWAHKKVQVVVDGKTIEVHTLYNKPQDVLRQVSVKLEPKDEYRMSKPSLSDGDTIEVFRAVEVTIEYRGKIMTVLTGKPTVGEVAASVGIPSENIKLIPDAQTRVVPGLKVKAVTLREEIVKESRNIPYSIIRQPDSEIEKGMEQTVKEGQEGVKEVTVKVSYADEEEVKREDVAEKVVEAPVSEIIHVGTRDIVETSRGAMRFRRIMWMEATAYNPTDGSPEGLTATGIPARRGIVAVDPDVIPLGTRLYIPGYGLALAADTGGAINGSKVDLCMEDYDEAWDFGRRSVKVYVLTE